MNFKLQSSLQQMDDVMDKLENAVTDVNKRLHLLQEEKAEQQTELWRLSKNVHTLDAAQEEYDTLLTENERLEKTLNALREPVVHILQAAKNLGTELEQ